MKHFPKVAFHMLALALVISLAPSLARAQDSSTRPAPDNTKVNSRDRSQTEPTADQQKENRPDREIRPDFRTMTYPHFFRKTRAGRISPTRRLPRRPKGRRQGLVPVRSWVVVWDGSSELAHWRFPASDPSSLPVPWWPRLRERALGAQWAVPRAL